MRICAECGHRWGGRPEEAVAVVRGLPGRLDDLGLRDDDDLRVRPAPGVWSTLEYLAHTGDAIDWYAGRIARVLAEDRPALEPFDFDAHAEGYRDRSLSEVLAGVRAACAGFAAGLGPDTAWERAGTGSDGEPRSVARLVDRAAHEARHHLRDVTLRTA